MKIALGMGIKFISKTSRYFKISSKRSRNPFLILNRPLTGFKWQFSFIEFPPDVDECNLVILVRQYYMELKIQLKKLDSGNIYEFSFPNVEACAASLLEIIQSGPSTIQSTPPSLKSAY